jgi:hypothetical protein
MEKILLQDPLTKIIEQFLLAQPEIESSYVCSYFRVVPVLYESAMVRNCLQYEILLAMSQQLNSNKEDIEVVIDKWFCRKIIQPSLSMSGVNHSIMIFLLKPILEDFCNSSQKV